MAEAQRREALESAWWQVWHQGDFSWEGLANPDVFGHLKRWQGWVIVGREDGDYAIEAETGRLYGGPEPEELSPAEGRKATLQDYWRLDPKTGRLRSDSEMGDELVRCQGQRIYHRVHLPLTY